MVTQHHPGLNMKLYTQGEETDKLGRWPECRHLRGKQSTGMGRVGWQVQLPVIPCITGFVVLTPSVP